MIKTKNLAHWESNDGKMRIDMFEEEKYGSLTVVFNHPSAYEPERNIREISEFDNIDDLKSANDNEALEVKGILEDKIDYKLVTSFFYPDGNYPVAPEDEEDEADQAKYGNRYYKEYR